MTNLFARFLAFGVSAALAATSLAQSSTPADTTPPPPPIITSYDATSSTPSFRGTAEPLATVTLSRLFSSQSFATTAAADGTWIIVWSGSPLVPDSYFFNANATDAAGNRSSSSSYVKVTVAPTAPPVVKQVPDLEVTYHWVRRDYDNFVSLEATNPAAQFAATGLPPGVTLGEHPSGSTAMNGVAVAALRYTFGGLTGGSYNVSITATNSVGTSAPMRFRWVVHPGIVGDIYPDKYTYHPGETITFRVTFSAPVVVTGTPYIQLWGSKKAMYASGGGTTTLTFTYQVAADDPQGTPYSVLGITGSVGSIQTVDGVSATLGVTEFFDEPPKFIIAAASGYPVVSDATVTGVVGVPIAPVQLQATNSPTSFDVSRAEMAARGLLGLQVSSTGLITGTPTEPVNGTLTFTATNANGVSAPGTITVNIAAAPVTTPPPTTPPPTTAPPPVVVPPPPTKQNQTISFSSPVSSVLVGVPVQLGATSSAGLPITYTVVSGDADINGTTLIARSTAELVVRASSTGNDQYNATSTDVNFGQPQKQAQSVNLNTTGGKVPAESTLTLSGASSAGLPVAYTVVSGPATISGNTLTFTGTGNVTVRASQPGDGTYQAAETTITFIANPVDRLVNISSRLHVGPDDAHVAIAGFVVTGRTAKPMLIRAVGPGLSAFGISDGVGSPQLQLMDSSAKVIASNSGWNDDAQISAAGETVGAFRLAGGSKDSAVVATLAPGAYTAQVSSATAGSVLIEVYDGSSNAAVPTKQLVNISTRGAVDAGDALIGGFVIRGAQSKRVLIRAVGPGLAAFGVSGVLSDPVVKVYDANGAIIAQNDNWETGQSITSMPLAATAAQVTAAGTAAGAFALNAGANDAAVVITLEPGAYTAVVTGANSATGAALVEVYELSNE